MTDDNNTWLTIEDNENLNTFKEKLKTKVETFVNESLSLSNKETLANLSCLFDFLTSRLDKNASGILKCSRMRYYEFLSDHYLSVPVEIELWNDIEVELWDNPLFQSIKTLLFYKRVLKLGDERRKLNAFIKSIYKLFWMDIEKFTKRFKPIYQYLFVDFFNANEDDEWPTDIQHVLLDLFNIASNFYFYYYPKDNGDTLFWFISKMQINLEAYKEQLDLPKGHKKIQALNMFSNEMVRQLQQLSHEETILLYLKQCAMLRGPLEIPGRKTRIRLYSVLLDYTTPGTPLYPTRKIRDQANETIDLLFPKGRFIRTSINWMFRFGNPYELVRSWWYWLVNWIWTFMFVVKLSIFSLFPLQNLEEKTKNNYILSLFVRLYKTFLFPVFFLAGMLKKTDNTL